MSNTSGEPASAGEITELQEAGAADETTTVVRTSEVEEALLAISDKLFLIKEHGGTIGSGRDATIVTAEHLGRRLALKIHKPYKGPQIRPEQRWDDKVFNIIQPHVCSAVGYARLHDGKGNDIAWVMPRHLLNLRELIDSQRPFPYATAVDLIVQLALGMRTLHKRKIMHRDIRAANVLVTAIASPKFHSIALADFDGGRGVVGTGFWRAPEILRKANNTRIPEVPYDFPCDVYSFAVTCYEILTGKKPFPGADENNYDIVLVSRKRPPLPDHLPHEITCLIHQCWNQEPSLRPDADEILDLLRNILLHDPDLKAILSRLDLADIWSGENRDTPPAADILQSLQDDLVNLESQGETEAARLGEEFITIYERYVTKFDGVVNVWNRQRFWEKAPVVLAMVNKGNEFVNSLPDKGGITTVQTLQTYSRLVRPIVFLEVGSAGKAFRRYPDALMAFANRNGVTLQGVAEEIRVFNEKFWASGFMCKVRYHSRRIVKTVKRRFGVRDTSQEQFLEQFQELLDRVLLTDNHKASRPQCTHAISTLKSNVQ